MNFGTFGLPKGSGLNSGLFGVVSTFIISKNLWTPVIITPQLWFDSADTSTIIQSGGLMTQWTNKGVASNNATATTPQQPTYGIHQLNGKNLVSVRGSGIGMTTGYTLNAPYTIVLVSRNALGGRVVQSDSVNALMCPANRVNSFYVNSDIRSASLTSVGQWSTITMQILGINPSRLWYNSVDYANGGTHGNWGGFNIGAVGTNNENADAEIAEILVFNYTLNTEQREQCEGYIAHKWNLLADLPTSHLYKINPPEV